MNEAEIIHMLGMIASNTPTTRTFLTTIVSQEIKYSFIVKYCRGSGTFVAEFSGDALRESLTLFYEEYDELKRVIQHNYGIGIITNVSFLVEVNIYNEKYLFNVYWHPPLVAMIASYSDGAKNSLITDQDTSVEIVKILQDLYYIEAIEYVYDAHEITEFEKPLTLGFGWHKDSNTFVAMYIGEKKKLLLSKENFDDLSQFLKKKYNIQRLKNIYCTQGHEALKKVLVMTKVL